VVTLRSKVGAFLASCGLVLGFASPASAHTISTTVHWITWDQCVDRTALMNEGATGGGYSSSVGTSKTVKITPAGPVACGAGNPKPAGWIAGRIDLWKWSPTADRFQLCREMKGWVLKPTTGYKLVVNAHWDTPCGPGYYGTSTQIAVYVPQNNITQWVVDKGHVWAGWDPSQGVDPYVHWLPESQTPEPQVVGRIPGRGGLGTYPSYLPPNNHPVPANGILSSTESTDQFGGVTTVEVGPDAFIAYSVS
jgi:hypothetical protein